MSTTEEEQLGINAINKLKSSDPPLFLSPNSELSSFTRNASQYLFTSLKPYTPKSPFEQLLVNGFDAEQIWQQIDLQSQPLINTLKREIKRFEKNPDQILDLFGVSDANGVLKGGIKETGDVGFEGDGEEFEGLSDDDDEEEEEEEDEEEEKSEEEEEDDGDDESGEEELEYDDDDGMPEVEDEFLKIKDLEKYLVREEKKEYGSDEKKDKKKKKGVVKEDEDDEDAETDEEEDDDNELMLYGGDVGGEDDLEDNIRYDDFFVPNKKLPKNKETPKRKRKQVDESDEEMGDEKDDDLEMEDEDEDEDDTSDDSKMEDDDSEQNKGNLSTFEKERENMQAKIKQMEAENLAPKDWTMQGEVSASKRPKDSALEVDLDFEHNVRPPPVITEEVTASLEEIIKKRILEGHFDDVQRAPKLASAAPKEAKELDDNKSKKGLAEIYEEDYAQQTGLASAPLSFNDELKKEASGLFKRLCLKLDALSHFHFSPKPVVEDMAIQTNIPALAMEEIAPVAVSDAAMLAPEEVFAGKKVVKEENEFTKEDRKKRRAKKKRKLKAINAKKAASRAPEKPSQTHTEDKE